MLHRGDIVALVAPRGARGHEQKGKHYAVVVQAAHLSGLSTVVVAPTSSAAQSAEFRPEVTIRGRKTKVLADQVRSADAAHLGRPAGHLSAHELRNLDDALRLVLGLF